jgi:L-threonylcarbamoyladenylate synthase
MAYSPGIIAAATAAGAAVAPMPADAEEYGQQLYATLRQLDAAGPETVMVEAPPASAEWLAVRDRLGRAAHRQPEPIQR